MLRTDVLKTEDLLVGMDLLGTVRNVVDFGAFVDIGVKQDGLLHKSQIPLELFSKSVILLISRYLVLKRSAVGSAWGGLNLKIMYHWSS